MENKIYSVGISFIIEVEAVSAMEAQNQAIDILRWKMYEHEAKYLQLRITAAKKVVPHAMQPATKEVEGKLTASFLDAAATGTQLPEAEVIPDPLMKDDIPF